MKKAFPVFTPPIPVAITVNERTYPGPKQETHVAPLPEQKSELPAVPVVVGTGAAVEPLPEPDP
jgi:hypothetical protein